MFKFVLILLPVLALIFIYMFFFLRRGLRTFSVDTEKRGVKISLIAVSVLVTLACTDISSLFTVFVLHLMFIGAVLKLFAFLAAKLIKNKEPKILSFFSKVYKSGILAAFIAVSVLLCGVVNFYNVRPTEYTVYTEKTIRSEGYKIVLIADVHYGVSLDYEALNEKCAEISNIEPDIVVLCGDIVDNSTSKEGLNEVFKAFGNIKSNFGIYYVYGNHDRSMRMMSNKYGDAELERAITENGIKILRDETEQINGEITLVGREDRSRERKPLSILQENINDTDFVLVLDHQPSEYSDHSKEKTDLVLSGHTHAGQFFPINYLQELIPFNDGVYGLYDIGNETSAVVTSGFAGWAYPSKTSAPSEYVVIDIKNK